MGPGGLGTGLGGGLPLAIGGGGLVLGTGGGLDTGACTGVKAQHASSHGNVHVPLQGTPALICIKMMHSPLQACWDEQPDALVWCQ